MCNVQKAGEPVICNMATLSVSYSRGRLVPLAPSSPLPFFQSFHKKMKHSLGTGCHCCEWVAVAAQSGCIWGREVLPVGCALKTGEYVCPLHANPDKLGGLSGDF